MAAQTKFGRLVGSAFAVSLAFGAIFAANAQSGWQSIDAGPTTSAPQAPSGGGWTAFDGIEFVRNKDAVATERMLAGLAILLETAVVEPGIKAVHGKRLQRDLGSVTEVRTWLLRLEEHAGSAQGADVALAKDLFGSLRKLVSEAVGNLDRGTDFGGLLSRLGSSDGPDIGSILGRLGGSSGFASALGRLGGSGGLGSIFGPAMSQITQALQQGSWQGAIAAIRRAVATMRQRRATRRPSPPPATTTATTLPTGGGGTTTVEPPSGPPPLPPDFPNPWRPTTVPYDPDCSSGCQEVAVVNTHHGAALQVYIKPGVDDAIAQWGDCLRSVARCVQEKHGQIAACVAESVCPDPCKRRVADKTADMPDGEEAVKVFQGIFLRREGVCWPRENARVEP